MNILTAKKRVKKAKKQKQNVKKETKMHVGRLQTCHALTSSECEMPQGTQRRQVGQGMIS